MSSPVSALNPYASFLGDRDPLHAIEAAPSELARLIDGVSPERLTAHPAPGKWSVRDILAHLADTEAVFAFRLRQTAAEPHHVIQPFDQDKFAAPYGKLTAKDALDAFSAFRKWNLLFIQSVIPDAYSKTVTHPERGTMTFRTIVETMGGHDQNHIRQIGEILNG